MTGIIDVNVWLSRWPFRRLPLDETPELVAKLRSLGVTQAWAGSFDAILHRDIAGVNARLAEDCRTSNGLLVPFGTVNPTLPDWEEDLRRCHEVHRMPGVRLLPNYHGYKLDDPVFAKLLDACARCGLLAQIVGSMEDERTQHPLVRVPPVDFAPLPKVMDAVPAARVVLLNALHGNRGQPIVMLGTAERIWSDIAMLEGVGGIATALARAKPDRLLLGSYAPFFYPEAAMLKLKESALEGEPLEKITHENAEGLLKP
jgi:hypothetical protein